MDTHFDIAVTRDLEWRVNGASVNENVTKYLNDECFQNFSECPHCSTRLMAEFFDDLDDTEGDVWHLNRSYEYQRCAQCGYWKFKGTEGGNKCMDSQDAFLLSSVAARFAPTLPEGCSHELAQYLRRCPEHWHAMRPKDLELLVADIFRANYHDGEVFHVGKPQDRGVDVVFIEANNTKWLVQVKRRENPRRAESFGTLQSILGAMALDGSRHGIVVSTADSFSYYAKRAAEDALQQGFKVKLVDKGKLNRMVTPLLPVAPWEEIFKVPDLNFVAKDVQRHFWGPACDRQVSHCL